MAETQQYAYASTYHPERLPDGIVDQIRQRMPNRLTFIRTNIFPPDQPSAVQLGAATGSP